METQKDRIKEFIKYLNVSVRYFERSIGVSNATITLSKDNLSSNVLERTCATYPILNKVWLLTGVGEMIVEPKKAEVQYVSAPYAVGSNIQSPGATTGVDIDTAAKIAELQAALAEKEGTLAELKTENSALREENMQLKIDNARMQGRLDVLQNN